MLRHGRTMPPFIVQRNAGVPKEGIYHRAQKMVTEFVAWSRSELKDKAAASQQPN